MTLLYKLVIAALFSCALSAAQGNPRQGTISGRVIDKETLEPLPAANVVALGTTFGAASNNDGDYLLTIPPGRYALRVSYIFHQAVTVHEVLVSADSVTKIDFSLENMHADTSLWESKARQDIASGNIRIIFIGLLITSIPTAIYDSIVARYGFQYEADCTAYPEAADIYNRIVTAHLDSLNGPGWQERLKCELDCAPHEVK